MANVSPDIQWRVLRKSSAFIRRQRGIPKHFSTEKFNIKGVNSLRYNGLIHKRGLHIEATSDGKGITVVTKLPKKTSVPRKSTAAVDLKRYSRKSLKSVKNIAKTYKYPFRKLAQRRASQLLRSLRPISVRRGRRVRKAEV